MLPRVRLPTATSDSNAFAESLVLIFLQHFRLHEVYLSKNQEFTYSNSLTLSHLTSSYGAKRTRTADFLNAIEVLYQLSYSPLYPYSIMAQFVAARQVTGELRRCELSN